jgi:hypothetical protein
MNFQLKKLKILKSGHTNLVRSLYFIPDFLLFRQEKYFGQTEEITWDFLRTGTGEIYTVDNRLGTYPEGWKLRH